MRGIIMHCDKPARLVRVRVREESGAEPARARRSCSARASFVKPPAPAAPLRRAG